MVELRDVSIGIGGCSFPFDLSSFFVVCRAIRCFDMFRVHSFACTWLFGATHADPTNRETTQQNTIANGHHVDERRGSEDI